MAKVSTSCDPHLPLPHAGLFMTGPRPYHLTGRNGISSVRLVQRLIIEDLLSPRPMSFWAGITQSTSNICELRALYHALFWIRLQSRVPSARPKIST